MKKCKKFWYNFAKITKCISDIFLVSHFNRDLEAPDLVFKAYDYYAVISGNFSAIIWLTPRMFKNFAHSFYYNLPVKILCHYFEVSRIEIYSNIRLYILIYIKGCVYGFIGLWKVSFKGDEKMINQKENMSENYLSEYSSGRLCGLWSFSNCAKNRIKSNLFNNFITKFAPISRNLFWRLNLRKLH